jgi:hypothetical protein
MVQVTGFDEPAMIVAGPGHAPSMSHLRVVFPGSGRQEWTHVHNCHRDTPEWRVWNAALRRKDAAGKAVAEAAARSSWDEL